MLFTALYAQSRAYAKSSLHVLNLYFDLHMYTWPGSTLIGIDDRHANYTDIVYLMVWHVCKVGANSSWCNSLVDNSYLPKDSDQRLVVFAFMVGKQNWSSRQTHCTKCCTICWLVYHKLYILNELDMHLIDNRYMNWHLQSWLNLRWHNVHVFMVSIALPLILPMTFKI